MPRSRAEDKNVPTDHDVGFMAGSRPRYDRRKKGVAFETNVGIVDDRSVIGRRCAGIRYAGDRVCRVPIKVLGPSLAGVRMSRVRAASTGARTRAESDEAAVAMSTVAAGESDDKTAESGTVDEEEYKTSCSATPNSAARKLRKNVSSVLDRML
jgi:hypothetical protein